jgi:hypothetical protein
MAQIVCIDTGTVRPGLAAKGDVVSIHDDNVGLSGSQYDVFKIIQVKGMTSKEVQDKLQSLEPEQAVAFKSKNITDTWGFAETEKKQVWKDGDIWRDLATRPKYSINLASLGDTDIADLADEMGSVSSKAVTLELKAVINLKEIEANKVAVDDLNVKAEEVKP